MRIVCMILLFAVLGMAQIDPEYVIPKKNPHTSPADLKNGQQLFMGQCARCHGPKGEGGRGAVLAQPRLRHAPDDQALFLIIRDGIKGSEMPAGYAVDTLETWQLAAYVRSLGRIAQESLPGDSARGEQVYQSKGHCSQCHVIGGQGGVLGPELTEIGTRRSAAHLRAAVLDPESTLPEGFLEVRLVTADGKSITGVRLNEDVFTIQILDLNGGLHSFFKKDLKELQRQTGQSPMPAFRGTLSAAEVDDLVAYLASLKGNPRGDQ
ncbi:MAG TPA: c-type cytochrome [Bryobacteraceae bacterium]|nr:c-type cytochrome [Bryobacteraceae bacterium]